MMARWSPIGVIRAVGRRLSRERSPSEHLGREVPVERWIPEMPFGMEDDDDAGQVGTLTIDGVDYDIEKLLAGDYARERMAEDAKRAEAKDATPDAAPADAEPAANGEPAAGEPPRGPVPNENPATDLRPEMSAQEIADAGALVDIPYDIPAWTDEPIRYADLGPDRKWVPPEGFVWDDEIDDSESGQKNERKQEPPRFGGTENT
jgi:hypothetical protein